MSQQEIKGNLARLLATENLVVEHRKVPTAQFNVDSRVLTLPLWDLASNAVYDMLVGHEVGHALFTPNVDFREQVTCPKDFVNVIEDARIEKLMKRKYAGLRKSFAQGYTELNNKDFFEVADKDLSEFGLIDRINLHFKLGATALVPFNGSEMVFVARTDQAETFEEVLEIAQDVYNWEQTQKTEEKEVEVELDSSSLEGIGDMEGEGNSEDQDTSSAQAQPRSGGAGGTASSKFDRIDADDLEQMIQDEDDGVDDLFDELYGEVDSESDEGGEHGTTSQTQRSFDDKSGKLSSESHVDSTYVEIPKDVNLEDFVVDWKVLHKWIGQHHDAQDKELFQFADHDYKEFRAKSQKEVNYMVKEFECRKSADAYARAGESKTGILDTKKLYTYKYNEDVFKKITVLPDCKNHGMIFVLDWSGSMSYELLPTVKQLLNLTAFCKKVQIPFEVYAFTNEWTIAQRAIDNNPEAPDAPYRYRSKSESLTKNEILLDKGYFHLMNFVSSRSNSKDYERMCLQLFREARYYSRRQYQYGSASYYNTPGVGLSGTPLNEAIILLNYIVPQFRKDNDLQKVNCVVLTDGDACTTAYGREWVGKNEFGEDESRLSTHRIDFGVILRDRQTGIVYRQFTYGDCTNIFIQQLKDRNPDVNILGFRILNGTQLSSYVCTYGGGMEYYPQIQKQWRKEKSAIIPNPVAYSALYAISNNAIDADTTFEAKSDKKADISRAFRKMLSNKAVNKKLLNSFVSMVA